MNRTIKSCFICIVLIFGVQFAHAASPILLIEGATRTEGAELETIRLTMEDIRSYGVDEISMQTIWLDDVATFEVVDLSEILAEYGIVGRPIVASALNNYSVTIPADAVDEALLAVSMDGEPMSPASKGPLWILFDFNDPKYANDPRHTTYSVWQLFKISPAE